jgi:uncharacterized protein DUF6319
MAQLLSLSDQDLAQLRAELAGGKPPMVWFTSAAVGVAAGGSAKVVAFADTAEGDYIQVRPTGSKDVLSFSPPELTRTRPPRRKTTAKPARSGRVAARTPEPVAAAPKPAPTPAPAPAPKAQPAPPPVSAPAPVAAPAKPAPRRAARGGSGAAQAKSAEVVVTLTSTADGEWTVDVVVGKKRTVRNTAVGPAEVAKAARALPAAVGVAIDASLATARTQQQARVAALQAELELAQRALKDLG